MNNTKNEIINENNAIASVNANPKIAKRNNSFLIPGFLANPRINAEKINPIPIPAPHIPTVAIPAPNFGPNVIFFYNI